MRNRSILILAMVALFLSVSLSAQPPDRGRFKAGELVCKMLFGYSIGDINARYGTTIKQHQAQIDCYLLHVPQGQDAESLAVEISMEPGVEYCLVNYYLSSPEGLQRSSPFLDQQVIMKVDTQFAAASLGLISSWGISTGTDVKVALIDGGVDFAHPEFADGGELISRFDYVDQDSLAYDETGGIGYGHGTFIAGIIRLVAPDCDLKVYRVLDTSGLGDGFSVACAVLQAIDDSCRVINLSLGMTGVHQALDDALRLARQQGVVVTASAGNDSTNVESIFPFPAERAYCLAIAALDSQMVKASFSNYGVRVDLCAPGIRVYGPFPLGRYAWWDGTSFSTPFVSGLVAAMLALNPGLVWEEIDTTIRSTAVNVDALNPEYAGMLGAGQIQPVAALEAVVPSTIGDINEDRSIDVVDLTMLIDYLFILSSDQVPGPQADMDCTGSLDIGDLTILISVLFLEGSFPCSYP